MAPDTDQGGLADPVAEALREGADLQRRLVMGDAPEEDLLDEIEEVRKKASEAGEYAWTAHEREDLDLIVRRFSRVLRRAGRRVSEEHARVQPFRGRNPSFDHMTHDELVEAIKSDEKVVARRLVAPEDARQIKVRELAGAEIIDCAFIGWSFDGVDLSNSRIVHTVFQGCSFEGVNLSEAVATTSLFTGRQEERRSAFTVRAPEANFSGSWLGGFDISGAVFEDAAFSYAYLGDAVGDENTTFERASFDLASVDGLVAPGANLNDAVFVGASLVRVDLRDARLARVSFSSAKVAGARFEGADLTQAGFRSAYYVGLAHFDKTGLDADLSEEDRHELEDKLKHQAGDDAKVDLRANHES